MHKGCASNSPVWIKVLQWLGVMALLTIVAMGLWAILFADHTSTSSLKWFQFLQTLGTFFLPPLVCAWLWSSKPFERLHLTGKTDWKVYCVAIGVMIVALPGINLLADWNSRLVLPDCLEGVESWMKAQEQAATVLTERFLSGTGVGVLLVNIGLMALLPAMAEELTFRGTLQEVIVESRKTATLKVKSHVAVWVTAILFSAIHMQFYGFVPRMLLGALFGYMLLWTGSLWVPITMHFVNNLFAVVAYWVVYNKGLNPEAIDAFGTGSTLWVGIVSLVLTVGGVYFFWRLSRQMSNASSRMS